MSPLAVLVGLPGAGKSTVGRLMAERLGVTFRDTDDDVERMAGRPVPEIFAESGEAHFRLLEEAAVRAALAAHEGVLALGGGAVLSPGTRALLMRAPVVHLAAEPGELLGRHGALEGRPLLASAPAGRLRELAAARGPLYREVARVTVRTGSATAAEVASRALAALFLSGVR
ncbi:shikimate kinase [Streptomyces sp. NPDC051956]|uniref:shikimate kinase n=1 Tax=Streptomyces sp. NPDC051956 TaxID=3365677 RepID=UPI0037D5604B